LKTTYPSERICLLVALCTGLALRLLILLRASAIEMDGIGYATMAEQFVRGLFGQALGNVFPPFYPLFVGLFHLVIPDVELAGRLVSLVFGILLIYVSFIFAKRILGSGGKAVLVAFLVALHPYLVRYSGTVLSESLATLLFTVTVFTFYTGWQEESRWCIVASGLCLALTYLTRPEYLVFYAPFMACLLPKRRFRDMGLFLLPFLCLGLLYMGYLWSETGLVIVSRKVMQSPFVSIKEFFGNIPLVAYEWFIAMFPPFLVFGAFGIGRVERSYRNLVLLLLLFHILSLSYVSHATRRYSVEFIPLFMVFAVEGIYAGDGWLVKFFAGKVARYALIVLIVCAAVFQSFAPPRYDRVLHKKAGLFLLHYDPGSVVACRLPLVAFYEKGTSVNLVTEMSGEKNLARFKRIISERKVKYCAFDEETERTLPFLGEYLSGCELVYAASEHGSFVRVYRF
jgi:hypothetical protein